MAPVYSGSLTAKKKLELQEITRALRISGQGTKDEIVQRITKHLDANQDSLEDNPSFAGLFGRRKRSVQPQPIPTSRLAGKPPITPIKELRAVSFPPSPDHDVSNAITTPASPSKSLIERFQSVPVHSVVRQFQRQHFLQTRNHLVISLRLFLSNSRNIWCLTAFFELLYILSCTIPWQHFQIPLPKSGPTISLPYPPLVLFQTSTFWLVLVHWALPALVLPVLFGSMITFKPAFSPSNYHHQGLPVGPLDPLTASIIHLAAQIIYPYSSIASKTGIVGLDVLGSNWRIFSASVNLAFSIAETIDSALPILKQEPLRQADNLPSRRAITATEEDIPDEVD